MTAAMGRRGWWRTAVVGGVVVAGLVAIRQLPVAPWLEGLQSWVEGAGWWGRLVFVAGYVLATVLALPGSLLTVGAGITFGVWQGVVLVSVGSTVGAAAAFLIARYLARGAVQRRLANRAGVAAVDAAIAREGMKIVFLLRLSPVFPFVLLNYLLGLTGIPFWHYVAASWVGMLPGTLLYVYLGHASRTGVEMISGGEVDLYRLGYTVVGVVATGAVAVYVTRLARRALRQRTKGAGLAGEADDCDGEACDEC